MLFRSAKSMGAKDAFVNEWQRVDKDNANSVSPEGSYVSTDGTRTMAGPEFNARVAKFRTDLNADPNMRKAGVQVDENGNTIGGEQAPAGPAAPAAQPAKPAAQQQPVIRNGQGQKLTDVPLARQYLAKAGGDKNKARQLAAQDHWTP